MLEVGYVLDGKYKILSEIGHGGMSVVYMALNEKANKTWAVKEIRKDGKMDFNIVRQGLVAEIETLKKLNHPNLPSIVDVIEDNDSFIIVMDYIEGNSLDKALLEHGAQPQENVIEWAMQLCDVLGYLHSCNPPIIYRDMKPANIMLKPDGNIALIDFGTAKTYEIDLGETTGIGTIGYAAPEQFIGSGMGRTDARTDIYCLGITLYHLLTGVDPCKNVIADKSIRAVNPALSPGLEEIIIKCTQPDPKDRYQSCDELLYAFEHYNEMGIAYRKSQKRKLNRFIVSASMTLISAIVAIFGFVSAKGANATLYKEQISNAKSIVIDVNSPTFQKDFTEKCNALINVIASYPGNPEPYNELLDLFSSEASDKGSMLSKLESSYLDKIKNNGISIENKSGYTETVFALDELKAADPQSHEDFCSDVGFVYWYDYEEKEGRYKRGGEWFGLIPDNNMAKNFKEIADISAEVKKYNEQSKNNIESGMKLTRKIEELWNSMVRLYDSVLETGDTPDKDRLVFESDDMRIFAIKEIITHISSEVDAFISLKNVTKEDVVEMLNGAKAAIEEYNNESLNVLIEQADEGIKRANTVDSKDKEAAQ